LSNTAVGISTQTVPSEVKTDYNLQLIDVTKAIGTIPIGDVSPNVKYGT
jgi:hypothetical protein